jgi:hypothetical protein
VPASPQPATSTSFLKKNRRGFACTFADEIPSVVCGDNAAGLHPLKYAATGSSRIHARVLRIVIDELNLA